MATSAGSGVGWWQHPQWKEEEEEDKGEPMGSGSPTRGRRAGRSLDRWNLSPSSSSSEEMLGDAGLPEELKDSRGPLEEELDDELDDDLNHLQDLGSLGDAEPASPLLGRAKEGANVGRLGSASHWHPQRDRQQEEEEEEEEEEAWAEHSAGEPYPELSYEGLYGSEFSTSPEALKDPLALYNSHDKPSRFMSDGAEEELSGNSQVSSEEFGRAVVGTLGQEGSSREFLEERDFSSESQKSPENFGPTSLVGSIRWSCSPLGGLSLEDFQNSPSLDSETFPESSWMENMAHPEGNGLEVATSSTVHDPQTPEEPRGSHLDVREVTGGSGALIQRDRQPPERARALGAEPPRWLPTKIGQRPRPVSPQRATSRRKTRGLGYHSSIRASQSTPVMSDPLPYGRGQLNHPLPDLSKVEPRVRFPRDPQSYHPPRGRTLPAQSKDSGKPVVFKSPAEIVREVLLSSGEGPPQKHPTAAVSVIPEELKSPQQATELVKQLQEDYRKLLTKYAEAENTIDRLRLGAKVRLYTDPPKPSHGVQMGTMSPASQVMTFSIPQIRAAEVTGGPDPAPDAVAVSQGSSGPSGASASPCAHQGPGLHKEDGFSSPDQPFSGEELTWVLAAQASKFWKQVESLEGLIRAGRLTPQDQLKGFARLKGVQDALEGAYLQARDDHRQRQKHEDPEGVFGDFDPDRALEGEIFRQGMWLEELKERMEQSTARSSPEVASPPPSPLLPQDPQGQMRPPAPSPQAPIQDGPAPYPEAAIPESSRHGDQLDLEVSSGSNEPAEDGQGLPEPLRIRQREVERGLDHLLDHYRSFKALPGAFSLEQLHPDGEEFSPEEVDGAAAGEAGRTDVFLKNTSRNQGTQLSLSSMREPRLSNTSQRRLSERSQEILRHISCAPGGQREGPISLESAEKSRIFASGPGRSPGKPPGRGSPPSSTDSVAGSSVPESVAPKPFRKTSTASSECPRMVPSEAHAEPLGDDVGMSSHKHDLRMVSPETDSGFVGSEASRRSPLAPMPKSHATPLRSRGALGRAAVAKGAAALLDPRWKVPRAVEPSGTDASPRHALPAGDLQRQRLAQGHPFHTSAPPGIASKVEPSGLSTPTDSKAEGGLKAYAPPPEEMGRLPGHSAALSSLGQTRCPSFPDSRLERNRAIAALQSEVLRLRRSLEETLCRPHCSPKHPPSPRTLRRLVPHQGVSRFSTRAKEMGKTSGNSMSDWDPSSTPSPPPMMMEPEAWTKRPLGTPSGTQENPDPSESDDLTPKSQKGKQQETSVSRAKFPKQTVLQGPYTGARYPLPAPEAQDPPDLRGPPPCSHGRGARPRLRGGPPSAPTGEEEAEGGDPQLEGAQPSQHPTQKEGETKPCLQCKERENPSRGALPQAFVRGREQPQAHNLGAQVQLHKPPAAAPQPGLWHTVAFAPATSMPCLPVVSYPLSSVIYSPLLATTSAASPADLPVYDARTLRAPEPKAWASEWPPQDGSKARLRDLNRSLRQAMEAARDMKATSHRMSQSLAWELSQAKSLRGSCLF